MDMTDYQDGAMSVVSSAEFQRNLGLYQDKALAEPVHFCETNFLL
jgi:hypothetical protein